MPLSASSWTSFHPSHTNQEQFESETNRRNLSDRLLRDSPTSKPCTVVSRLFMGLIRMETAVNPDLARAQVDFSIKLQSPGSRHLSVRFLAPMDWMFRKRNENWTHAFREAHKCSLVGNCSVRNM